MDRAEIVHSIRHFNRYYTNRLGLLSRYRFDTRFTLTEARILLEIGRHGEVAQRTLAAGLSIDAGYLSRVVGKLVTDGLAATRRDEADGRILLLRLTARGRTVVRKIDASSDEETGEIIAGLADGETEELVGHLRAAESILERRRGRAYGIVPADGASQIATARVLIREYVEFLGADLSFQGIEAELDGLPGKYAPPTGALLIASVPTAAGGSEPAGCVALRKLDEGICEMKRLFVRPEYRNLGLGRALAERVIDEAKRLGYATMRLDTLERLHGAVRLYTALDFRRCAPYCANPLPGAMFWEKDLGVGGSGRGPVPRRRKSVARS
ncbi:MAG TPA: helix-turn-helix domain-containing GNAT family N-acetyltransferase [Spirochaetia bacterium]